MLTTSIVVKEEGLETRQDFVDDVAGAVAEYQYWISQGKKVQLVQWTDSTDQQQ